jgi:hypothetical protein
VVARKSGFLYEQNAMTFLCKEGCGGSAGGAAADDDGVIVHGRSLLVFRGELMSEGI